MKIKLVSEIKKCSYKYPKQCKAEAIYACKHFGDPESQAAELNGQQTYLGYRFRCAEHVDIYYEDEGMGKLLTLQASIEFDCIQEMNDLKCEKSLNVAGQETYCVTDCGEKAVVLINNKKFLCGNHAKQKAIDLINGKKFDSWRKEEKYISGKYDEIPTKYERHNNTTMYFIIKNLQNKLRLCEITKEQYLESVIPECAKVGVIVEKVEIDGVQKWRCINPNEYQVVE